MTPSLGQIIFRDVADNPELLEKKTQNYRVKFANPFVAASRGYLDDIIRPVNTRRRLVNAFDMLKRKQLKNPPRKHDNLPL